MNRYLKVFILLILCCKATCQDSPVSIEMCFDPNVRTILFYRSGWDLSAPVLFIDKEEYLELQFDYLGVPEQDFMVSVSYCNYDWTINDIPQHEYIEGFNNIPLNEYQSSMNTTVFYTHFFLSIPNEDIKFLRSGNYLLYVSERDHPENLLFTRRFCVVESATDIRCRINRPDPVNQELQLQIDLKELKIINPIAEIKTVVIKNSNWNDLVKISSPPLLRDNILNYDLPGQIITPGNNEFRYFDTKTTKTPSERVEFIDFKNPYYYFILKTDELRTYKPYLSSKDLNGRYYIEANNTQNRHEEADYVYVHFSLHTEQAFSSDVYIYGALSGWELNENNYMTYQPEDQTYEKTLLLKQGYYNYAYVTKEPGSDVMNFDLTEGLHSETENEFIILIYYDSATSDYDRLIGYFTINTTEKNR